MDTQETPLQPQKKRSLGPTILIVAVVVIALFIFSITKKQISKTSNSTKDVAIYSNTFSEKDELKRITSDSEFISLFSATQNSYSRFPVTGGGREIMMKADSASAPTNNMGQVAERTSGTNVQSVGIDEPDIVKADNTSIFYSKVGQYAYMRGIEPDQRMSVTRSSTSVAMPPIYKQTKEIIAVNALPATSMKMQSTIPTSGEMLISNKTLVIFTTSEKGSLLLEGYSIINPATPKKLWELPFSNSTQKIGARLYKDTIYLTTSTSPLMPRPCPLPFIEGKKTLSIRCTDVYMPASRPASNAVYTVLKIDPKTGTVKKSLSMAGQLGVTTMYMSDDSIYLSYHKEGDSIQILNQFIAENGGVFPKYIEDKMAKLATYELSQSTKEIEMNSLLSQYVNSMDKDDKLLQENQLNNTFKNFLNKYKRLFEYTGIIKIKNESLSIYATGKVPGTILNQFSFDEWKKDLRVATTLGGQNPFYVLGSNDLTGQVSDVYVLGDKLNIKGSVKDLGKTERIYSVRFVADRGYVVTFRQTDPFYVLDLSNGNSPQLKGELKIPGYSSYLHPLDTHLILGIGKENQVKLSLFDVTDPTTPKEVSHYELANEYWSEAMNNHHAFLQDSKYKAFFMPGGRGGYVFSYDGNTLSLVKALESPEVKRGVYINDYLYIISDTGITSFKEGTWEKVSEFSYTPDDKIDNTQEDLPMPL